MKPLDLIEAIRESDRYMTVIFTQGGCYKFHLLLKRFWPDATPITNQDCDHVGSLIDGTAYDINGVVDWNWRPLYDDEEAEAKGWSFGDKKFIQVGECPVCEEPILQ